MSGFISTVPDLQAQTAHIKSLQIENLGFSVSYLVATT